jgi:bifunctional non-homologous end joining protein LigD
VLQNAFESARTRDIIYYVFDVPYYDGYDLTRVSLSERRVLLESLLSNATAPILMSQAFADRPVTLLKAACAAGLEGIIGSAREASTLLVARRIGSS